MIHRRFPSRLRPPWEVTVSFSRFRGCWTTIGGTLVCALVVGLLDVVGDGSCLWSAMVCPIWLIVGVVRSVLQRPGWGVTGARIVIPIATLLVAVANYRVQKTIAIGNAALLDRSVRAISSKQRIVPKAPQGSRPALLEIGSKGEVLLLMGRVRLLCVERPATSLVRSSTIRALGVQL